MGQLGTSVDLLTRSVLSSIPAATAVVSATRDRLTFAFVNPAFATLTGFTVEECVGADPDLILGEHRLASGATDLLAAITEERPAHGLIALVHKNGETIWTDTAAAPLMGGDGDGALGILTLTDVTDLKKTADDEREAAEYLAGVIRSLPGIVFSRVVRRDGTIEHHAPEWAVDGWSRSRAMTRFDPLQYVHPEDRELHEREIRQSIADRAPVNSEFRVNGAENGERWFRVRAVLRDTGDDLVWDGIGLDITEEKEREAWLASIVENIPGFLFRRVLHPDGQVQYPYVTPTFTRLLGLEADTEVTAEEFWTYIHPDDAAHVRESVERSCRDVSRAVIECRLLGPDGMERWIRSYATPRRLLTGGVAWDGIAVDVTAEKEAAQRLDYLTHHDPLTGLANRARFADLLSDMIADVRSEGGSLALSTVVLSGLSEINETLGPSEGDIALKGAAARLSDLAIGKGAIAARTAGNELSLARRVPGLPEDGDFAATLTRTLSRPIPVAGRLVMMEPCIGSALFSKGELEVLDAAGVREEMMKRSSMALSSALRRGAGSHITYTTEIDHRAEHRMELRHAMHRAIEADEFALHFQPIVDLATGNIVGAEALVRWSHPVFGMLRPDVFIPLAEQSGMIVALGEWVMRRALRQLRHWQDHGHLDLRMAVNVSALQVRTPGFVGMLRSAIAEAGIDAKCVEIEITEGLLLEMTPDVRAALQAIEAEGVTIAIDDFGAGHASFQYLRDTSVRKLKIDQMFVRQLVVNSSDAVIVQAIATLARSLSLELVAEGIETLEQRDFLRELGCTTGQGYLFSLPLDAEDFSWMLAGRATLPLPPHLLSAGQAPILHG